MQRSLSRAQQGLARLTLAGMVLQFYLAGVGAFGADSWDWHVTLGYFLGIPILALLVLALVGRLGRRRIGMTALVVVLYIVQMALAQFRFDVPYVAALHPVNALALMGATAAVGRPQPEIGEVDLHPEPARHEA